MPARTIRLVREEFPRPAGMSTAVSRALLQNVSAGLIGETLRIHVPQRIMAFGKQDHLSPGFERAVQAAAAGGFAPVRRLAGGRAAVFHEETVAFAWTIPVADPAPSIHVRFREISSLIVRALARLGVTAQVGEVPGEYCPGEYSVNHGGSLKLMGVGQRLTRHAAHVGGVVVVGGSALLKAILIPVYGALRYDWRPETAGAVADVVPGVTTGETAAAIVAEMSAVAELVPAEIDEQTIALAQRLLPEHVLEHGS